MMKSMTMRAFAGVSLCVVLSACESLPGRVSDKEDLLASAGFDVRPANTSVRRDSLKTLPANRIMTEKGTDANTYVYADPVVCQCLYVGDQKAYDRYRDDVRERNVLSEQELNDQMYEDDWAWGNWDWDGWGGRNLDLML